MQEAYDVWAQNSRRSAKVQGSSYWLGYFRVGDERIKPRPSGLSIGENVIDTSQIEYLI